MTIHTNMPIDLKDKDFLFFNHLNSFKDPFSDTIKNILHENNDLNIWMIDFKIIHDEKNEKIYLQNKKTKKNVQWVELIYEKDENNLYFIKELKNTPINWKKINWIWIRFINILKMFLNKWDIIYLNNKAQIEINWENFPKNDYYSKQWFIHRNTWYEYFIK